MNIRLFFLLILSSLLILNITASSRKPTGLAAAVKDSRRKTTLSRTKKSPANRLEARMSNITGSTYAASPEVFIRELTNPFDKKTLAQVLEYIEASKTTARADVLRAIFENKSAIYHNISDASISDIETILSKHFNDIKP